MEMVVKIRLFTVNNLTVRAGEHREGNAGRERRRDMARLFHLFFLSFRPFLLGCTHPFFFSNCNTISNFLSSSVPILGSFLKSFEFHVSSLHISLTDILKSQMRTSSCTGPLCELSEKDILRNPTIWHAADVSQPSESAFGEHVVHCGHVCCL